MEKSFRRDVKFMCLESEIDWINENYCSEIRTLDDIQDLSKDLYLANGNSEFISVFMKVLFRTRIIRNEFLDRAENDMIMPTLSYDFSTDSLYVEYFKKVKEDVDSKNEKLTDNNDSAKRQSEEEFTKEDDLYIINDEQIERILKNPRLKGFRLIKENKSYDKYTATVNQLRGVQQKTFVNSYRTASPITQITPRNSRITEDAHENYIETLLQKICYEVVSEYEDKLSSLTYSSFSGKNDTLSIGMHIVLTSIINRTFSMCNEFQIFVFYNLLSNLQTFIEYINNVVDYIVLSRGFLVKKGKLFYGLDSELLDDCGEGTKKLGFIKDLNNVTLSNIHDKLLNPLKNAIYDNEMGTIQISEREIFVKDKLDLASKISFSIAKPLVYRLADIERLPEFDKNIFKQYDGKNISLTSTNTIHFEISITPNVYSPSYTYIVALKFSYKISPRMQYIIDFKEENLTEMDIYNSDILIHKIEVFSCNHK